MRIRQFLAAAALLGAIPAFAQTEPGEHDPPKKVIGYKEIDTIDFDVVHIETTMKKPAGINITTRDGSEFPTMIDERVHFKRDLAKSAGFGIKRSVKSTETEVK